MLIAPMAIMVGKAIKPPKVAPRQDRTRRR
jgi:hypothetical protein